jgi:uncharacterized membrane protein YedE/YeeE
MEALSLTQLQALDSLVLWLSFALAVLLGWLVQRTHFCTMGALSDLLLMHDATRLRQWGLALAVSMLGLGVFTALGWLSPLDSIYALPRFPWLSFGLGGFVFGIGMVLASGCPTKNLVRLGGGSLKALVVLLVMGLSALATMRGAPGLLRVQWLDPATAGVASGPFIGQWLSQVGGLSASRGFLVAALLFALPLLLWVFMDRGFARKNNLLAGGGIGLVLLGTWWVSGSLGFVPEHPETLEPVFVGTASGRMEGLSFTGPVAQWLDAFVYLADGRKRITLGMALVPGVLLGAALGAWRAREFRWEGFTRTSDLARHLVGAVLMGIGGVSAMGCTFGQGLTGLSTLNWGSLVAVLAIVSGALLTLRVQWWLAERHG